MNGAAGGGKSFALLLEPLRHINNPKFGAVIFRRNSTQIFSEGGLWDTSQEIYGQVGHPRKTPNARWIFPSGAKVSFAHIENDTALHKWQGSQIAMIGFDELTHFCLTPETEVLTKNGWKLIADIKKGEYVPSLSSKGIIEMKEVLDTPSFDYDGELITVNQKNGISVRMTPNHKVPVMSQSNDKNTIYRFVTAEHMEKNVQSVIRSGKWNCRKEIKYKYFEMPEGRGCGSNLNVTDKILMDDWLEFLGWFLSEGSSFLASQSKGETSPCVSIRQTTKVDSLESLFDRLPWRSKSDGNCGYRIYSRQLYDVVHPLGNTYTKRIPRFIFELSNRQQRIFFDAFVAGDGYIAPDGGIQIGLANEGLIDDLHELSIYLGYSATKGGGITKTGYQYYSLSVRKRSFTQIKTNLFKREKYKGKVHCLTVADNHTFLIRHNNRTHWTGNSRQQFFYMLSRNRSTCGVKPYIRATCNPDCDSFVADLISWWIDQDTGYPIPERSGVIRYFGRLNDVILWGDTVEEVVEQGGGDINSDDVKSFTFIASTLQDNQILLKTNPGYLANLKALATVERERLLYGNWKIRPAAGLYFPRNKVTLLNEIPNDIKKWVRAWDLAATEDKKNTKPEDGPAYTAGVLIGKRKNGRYFIGDVINRRMNSSDVRNTVLNTAKADKAAHKHVRIRLSQDPGQAGKEQIEQYIKMLSGFSVSAVRETGSKETRAEALSAQWIGVEGAELGNVDVLIAPWTEAYLSQMESFPQSAFKDMVDASANGFNELESMNTSSPPPKSDGLKRKSYWS